MKKIDIPAFGVGQQIWFNMGRLRRAEAMLGQSSQKIIESLDDVSVERLVILLQCGMEQNGRKSPQHYEQLIDEAIDNGYSLIDIHNTVSKALIASGCFGKALYYQIYPEEMTDEIRAELEKN